MLTRLSIGINLSWEGNLFLLFVYLYVSNILIRQSWYLLTLSLSHRFPTRRRWSACVLLISLAILFILSLAILVSVILISLLLILNENFSLSTGNNRERVCKICKLVGLQVKKSNTNDSTDWKKCKKKDTDVIVKYLRKKNIEIIQKIK